MEELEIEHQYDCVVCGEEWTTCDHYEDGEPYSHENICIFCSGDLKMAFTEVKNNESLYDAVKYTFKRFYNKFILALRILK